MRDDLGERGQGVGPKDVVPDRGEVVAREELHVLGGLVEAAFVGEDLREPGTPDRELGIGLNGPPGRRFELAGPAQFAQQREEQRADGFHAAAVLNPASDLEGLKRVGIERKAKAQKLRDLVRQGQAQRSVDEIQFEKDEYPKYLKAAYGEESFPKPRNLIGLAVDLPVAEMEKLMMQHAKATDDDMRQLASQRAQAVRDALIATSLVGAERLFIVAGKPLTNEEQAKLKGKPNRVDFTMK